MLYVFLFAYLILPIQLAIIETKPKIALKPEATAPQK